MNSLNHFTNRDFLVNSGQHRGGSREGCNIYEEEFKVNYLAFNKNIKTEGSLQMFLVFFSFKPKNVLNKALK